MRAALGFRAHTGWAASVAVGADDALRRRLVELGRDAGKPWAQDQKESALVAWLALASRSRAARPERRAGAGHGR